MITIKKEEAKTLMLALTQNAFQYIQTSVSEELDESEEHAVTAVLKLTLQRSLESTLLTVMLQHTLEDGLNKEDVNTAIRDACQRVFHFTDGLEDA